jgi:protein SCO1/2
MIVCLLTLGRCLGQDLVSSGRAPLDRINLVNLLNERIRAADRSTSMRELAALVDSCSRYASESAVIATALTGWLQENHPLYADRTPTEVSQFRGFIMAALGKFPPNEDLYKCVRYELLFGAHPFNITAAAVAARGFTDSASLLIPLLEPYLDKSYNDQWVDITTPELHYPVMKPTKAKHEIILTLMAYGESAYRSVKLMDAISASSNEVCCGVDTGLYAMAGRAAAYLRKVTPPCCRKDVMDDADAGSRGMLVIDRKKRKAIVVRDLALVDQSGRALQLADLMGKPFILTFFYTRCTNPLKCASTVHRLGELEMALGNGRLAHQVGIYGMTYDPDFDTPPVLRKYGEMYGLGFNDRLRLLKTADNTETRLSEELGLRVSYGAGSVNQHGIQLFVFDKRGRLAAVCDNDIWTVQELLPILTNLVKE